MLRNVYFIESLQFIYVVVKHFFLLFLANQHPLQTVHCWSEPKQYVTYAQPHQFKWL